MDDFMEPWRFSCSKGWLLSSWMSMQWQSKLRLSYHEIWVTSCVMILQLYDDQEFNEYTKSTQKCWFFSPVKISQPNTYSLPQSEVFELYTVYRYTVTDHCLMTAHDHTAFQNDPMGLEHNLTSRNVSKSIGVKRIVRISSQQSVTLEMRPPASQSIPSCQTKKHLSHSLGLACGHIGNQLNEAENLRQRPPERNDWSSFNMIKSNMYHIYIHIYTYI